MKPALKDRSATIDEAGGLQKFCLAGRKQENGNFSSSSVTSNKSNSAPAATPPKANGKDGGMLHNVSVGNFEDPEQEDFFDLVSRFQSKRMDDQRCPIFEEAEQAGAGRASRLSDDSLMTGVSSRFRLYASYLVLLLIAFSWNFLLLHLINVNVLIFRW
jgi:hypothetical protein